MEPVKHQNQQTQHQLSINLQYSVKLVTKFIASTLFFSLIFSCSSLLPFLFNYEQFFSSNTVKNYVFLLCNGILVLIVKNSGLFSNSPEGSSFNGDVKEKDGKNPKKVGRSSSEMEETVVVEEKVMREVEEMQKMEENSLINVEEEEDHDSLIVQGEVAGQGNGVTHPDEDREEALELPSAEELNKKCENFIRQMYEQIKLEAQQLVVVHY